MAFITFPILMPSEEKLMKNRSITHWIIIGLLCGLSASSIGICNNAVGVYYTPVSESLGVLRGTFALHATLSLMATAVTALFVPTLMKKFPYKPLLLIGVIMAVGSTILMGLSNNVMQFYILGIVRGVGSGLFASVPLNSIITNWFVDKHGLATSIALSFSGLAGAVCSPLITSFITNYGWRTAYFLTAAMIGICTIPALLYPWTITPEQSGLLPYGAEAPKEQKQKEKKKFNYFQLTFFLLAIMTFLHTSITGVSQHLSGYAVSMGMAASTGATMLSMTMLGNIASKLVIGALSDKFGPVKACISMIVLNIISLVLIIIGGQMNMVLLQMVGAFLFGSIYSVGAVGIALLTKHFFGTENFSSCFSIIGFVQSLGSSSSLTLIGYLYDFTGTYVYMFLIAIGFHLINMALITIIANRTRKQTA